MILTYHFLVIAHFFTNLVAFKNRHVTIVHVLTCAIKGDGLLR